MAGVRGRLREALVSNVNAPTVWLTAAFALVGITIGALAAVAVGYRDVALPAG